MMLIGEPNDMLVRMDISERKARTKFLSEYINDDFGLRMVQGVLENPTFRPLLELELNGNTRFRATRYLLAEGFVTFVLFAATADKFRGTKCEAVTLTPAGRAALWEGHKGLEDNHWFAMLRGAVVGYSCIDDGSGICLTREAFETALSIPDQDILSRCVYPSTGALQFPQTYRITEPVTDVQRAAAANWCSSTKGIKRSGRIVDL